MVPFSKTKLLLMCLSLSFVLSAVSANASMGSVGVVRTGLRNPIRISAGETHSLAIRSDGTVLAWGGSSYGQVGDGDKKDRDKPVVVLDLPLPAIQVSAGADHSLALLENGEVWAWGSNKFGQLGDSTNTDSWKPVRVPHFCPKYGAVGVAAGGYHSLAVCDDGTVWSWGDNSLGQLGVGSTGGYANNPKPVTVHRNAIQVAAGRFHSLAIVEHQVLAWGSNKYGQLGIDDASIPFLDLPEVSKLQEAAVSISCGDEHSLALTADGIVWAWGQNSYGQVGDGSFSDRFKPVSLGYEGAIRIAAGGVQSILIKWDGTMMTWGEEPGVGIKLPVPTLHHSGGNVLDVAAGGRHAIAIMPDGSGAAWGHNDRGQLGIGLSAPHAEFPKSFAPTGEFGFLSAAANFERSSAIRSDRTLWTWGDRSDPTPDRSNRAIKVRSAAIGDRHELAVLADGSLWAKGANERGQLGDGRIHSYVFPHFRRVSLEQVKAVDAGISFSVALTSDGRVATWGANYFGQLGDTTTLDSSYPVFPGIENVIGISAGPNHVLAVTGPGKVYAWGFNGNGELGDGSYQDRWEPTLVNIPGCHALEVKAGYNHSMALCAGGAIWAWGYNFWGQLGDGYSFNNSPDPVQTDFHFAVRIGAGSGHSFAIRADGLVATWGGNVNGARGDPPTSPNRQYQPNLLSTIDGAVEVSGGNWHSVVVRANGSTHTWGSNGSGQLGDGGYVNRFLPGGPVTMGRHHYHLDAGRSHALAVGFEDKVFSWGDGPLGTCGAPSCLPKPTPSEVPGLDWVMDVAAGSAHSLASQADGSLWTWGWNAAGQLGDGSLVDDPEPSRAMLKDVTAVSAGYAHSLAIQLGGGLYAWGLNGNGQLGDATTTNRRVPTHILGGVVAIATGTHHSVALTEDGTVYTWGSNSHGQVGDWGWVDRKTPAPIEICNPGEVAVAIAAGGDHSLARCSDGMVFAWGRNSSGQLGQHPSGGPFYNFPSEVYLPFSSPVLSIAAGFQHSMIVLENGDLIAFGENSYGQLGDNYWLSTSTPTNIGSFPGAKMAAGGSRFSLVAARRSTNTFSTGDNAVGELGDGTFGPRVYYGYVVLPALP